MYTVHESNILIEIEGNSYIVYIGTMEPLQISEVEAVKLHKVINPNSTVSVDSSSLFYEVCKPSIILYLKDVFKESNSIEFRRTVGKLQFYIVGVKTSTYEIMEPDYTSMGFADYINYVVGELVNASNLRK